MKIIVGETILVIEHKELFGWSGGVREDRLSMNVPRLEFHISFPSCRAELQDLLGNVPSGSLPHTTSTGQVLCACCTAKRILTDTVSFPAEAFLYPKLKASPSSFLGTSQWIAAVPPPHLQSIIPTNPSKMRKTHGNSILFFNHWDVSL